MVGRPTVMMPFVKLDRKLMAQSWKTTRKILRFERRRLLAVVSCLLSSLSSSWSEMTGCNAWVLAFADGAAGVVVFELSSYDSVIVREAMVSSPELDGQFSSYILKRE